jgi:transposase InsO family protein
MELRRRQARGEPLSYRFRCGRRPANSNGARCTPDAWAFFRTLYLDPRRPTIRLCSELTQVEANKEGWAWPPYRTICQRVNKELPAFIRDFHRLGERRWLRQHAPRIERDLSAVRPNECWIGDHAELDFLVRGEGGAIIRPWLTAWEDQRSRRIVGWAITSGPDNDTILAAFRDAVCELGAPMQVIIDNGKDYRSRGFSGGRRRKARLDEERIKSVLGRLGVQPHFCTPFEPQSKAIESFFRTVHDRFDKLFPTYCGNRPENRPEELF